MKYKFVNIQHDWMMKKGTRSPKTVRTYEALRKVDDCGEDGVRDIADCTVAALELRLVAVEVELVPTRMRTVVRPPLAVPCFGERNVREAGLHIN